jgi:energy-converting hydrogenase Eha subunit C
MITAVAAAEVYLDAVRLVAALSSAGESIFTAVLTLGAALGWPQD